MKTEEFKLLDKQYFVAHYAKITPGGKLPLYTQLRGTAPDFASAASAFIKLKPRHYKLAGVYLENFDAN